jgi:mannitol/fructose-specific phosphotransferase system IIA component (Ntr-type)
VKLQLHSKSNNPVEYEALDNQPVNLIFLLVGKDNLVSTHIKLLSRISRMMNRRIPEKFNKCPVEGGDY